MIFKLAKRTIHTSPKEDGNLLIWYVACFFVLMGVFGVAVDTSFNTYARNTLQNSLDSAVVAAASKTTPTTDGRIIINKQQALNTIESLYDQNRKSVPDAICNSSTKYKVTHPRSGESYMGNGNCWVMTSFRVNESAGTISVSVREYKPNYFLKMLGLQQQEFRLNSTARLTHTLENR